MRAGVVGALGARFVLGLAVVAATMAGTSAVALPRLAEEGAAMALARSLGPGSQVRVRFRGDSRYDTLLGHLKGVRVEARHVTAGGLRIDQALVEARRVDVDVSSLVWRRRIVVLRQEGLRATVTISERSLNDFVARQVVGSQVRVALGEGTVRLTAHTRYAGRPFTLVAEGRFVPRPRQDRVALAVDRLWVDGHPVPDALKDRLLAFWGAGALSIDLGQWRVPLLVQAIRVAPGQLVIEATAR